MSFFSPNSQQLATKPPVETLWARHATIAREGGIVAWRAQSVCAGGYLLPTTTKNFWIEWRKWTVLHKRLHLLFISKQRKIRTSSSSHVFTLGALPWLSAPLTTEKKRRKRPRRLFVACSRLSDGESRDESEPGETGEGIPLLFPNPPALPPQSSPVLFSSFPPSKSLKRASYSRKYCILLCQFSWSWFSCGWQTCISSF